MTRTIPRAMAAALVGALAGAAFLLIVFNRHPDLTFDMDRDLPARITSGFYPVELSAQVAFAWTSDRAQVNVPGVDRRVPWRCVVRFRGARAPEIPQPIVTLAIDGTALASRTAGNDYQEIEAIAPARPDPGLKVAIASSSTFVPGPSDPRPLGVQVDRVSCRPDVGHVMLPPGSVLGGAAAAAVFGAAFALFGFSTAMALAATVLIALVQAWPLSMGLAPYTAYADRVVWMAWWIVAPTLVGVKVLEWSRRRPLTEAARIVAAFSAAVLYVKLLALLHPAKAIVDALFHAHRLEYVLSGRYFFQVAAGGVPFPYAIALYVFAAPWAALTHDHIALLRVVVTASEAVSGICLYWAIARTWENRPAAVAAVVLLHLVPVSYWVVSNANLTNAFGQSAALVVMAAVIVWPLGSRDWIQVIGLSALAALAFLSHVSTCALLVGTMIATAFFYRWRGGRALMPQARSVVLAVAIAAIASVALYYGRPEFLDAYRTAIRARVEPAPAGGTTAASTPVPGQRLPDGTVPTMAMPARVGSAAILAGDALGWPTVVLALLGWWRLLVERPQDRLTWALAAWTLTCGAFVAFGILAPSRVGQQRYAMEFIARATYAGAPAAITVAARGALWAWREGMATRTVAVVLVGLACFTAAETWVDWVQ